MQLMIIKGKKICVMCVGDFLSLNLIYFCISEISDKQKNSKNYNFFFLIIEEQTHY